VAALKLTCRSPCFSPPEQKRPSLATTLAAGVRRASGGFTSLVRTSQRYGDKMKACWFIQAIRFMSFPPQMVDGRWLISSVAPDHFDQNPMH
jgi:hypothetical protein